VLFTKMLNVDGFMEPVPLNRVIRPTGLVMYMGVILDAKLTWRKQRMRKTYSSFWLCCQTLGKTWGLKAKLCTGYLEV